jgi:predicted dehydrogenase
MSPVHAWSVNRRGFIKMGAAAAAGAALPSMVSCTTMRPGHRPPPSQRIHLGLIGYGTIAQSTVPSFLNDERVQVIAVADPATDLPNYGYSGEARGGHLVGRQLVEQHYAEQKASGSFRGCRVYEDFREMLRKEDLDAVNISTPDHWHCAAAILAARRGLHIYGQKPLSLTVAEGRRMADEVRSAGVTFQTGSQQRSTAYFRIAAEYVRNGRLGKLQGIKVGLPGGHRDFSQLAARKDPEPVPEGLNFDLWQGPAPVREYRPALLPLNWRWNFDYSGGQITDWGAHHLDIVQWALDTDRSGPTAIENIRVKLPDPRDLYNTATDFDFDVVYASGVRVNVSNAHENGILFEGEGGRSIFVSREKLDMKPEDLRREKIGEGEVHLYESKQHERNFVDCIYSGEPTVTPAETAHRSITIAHIANIAIRLDRARLAWDPVLEKFPEDAEANALLSRRMRGAYAV